MSPDPKPTEIVLIERMEFIERENRRLRSAGRAMLVGMAIALGITVTAFIYSGSPGGGVPRRRSWAAGRRGPAIGSAAWRESV